MVIAVSTARTRRRAWHRRNLTFLLGVILGQILMLVVAVVAAEASHAEDAYGSPDATPARYYRPTGWATWPPCQSEDGSGQRRCVWDAQHMGDGLGHSVKIRRGGTDDVRLVTIRHHRAHILLGWRW